MQLSDATRPQLLDFDRAALAFWRSYEAMANEQKQVRESLVPNKLRRDHVWVPKYRTDADILARYYRDRPDHDALDPIVAAMSRDEFDQLMDDWDPSAQPEA